MLTALCAPTFLAEEVVVLVAARVEHLIPVEYKLSAFHIIASASGKRRFKGAHQLVSVFFEGIVCRFFDLLQGFLSFSFFFLFVSSSFPHFAEFALHVEFMPRSFLMVGLCCRSIRQPTLTQITPVLRI